MRIVAYFCTIVILAVLVMGCGRKKSEKPQAATWSLFSGVDYPEVPEESVVQLNKSDFATGKILSIEQIPLDMMIENRELRMYIKGDYLLFKHLEMRKGAYLLHVVSVPDYKVVATLCPFGEGPGEFTDIRVIPTEETDKLCYIRNLNKNQLFYLSLSLELIECGKLRGISDFFLVANENVYLGNNTMLVGLGAGDGMGVCAVNQKDSTVRGIIPFHFAEGANWFFYIGELAHSFLKKRGAFAFTYHDRLAFFDFDGKNIKMVRFGNQTLKTTSSPENPIYYYDCFASDKYVYAVYRESVNDADRRNPYYLEQYDWDGNPVVRYQLPAERGLYTGCATANDSVIYLIDYYEDNFLHKVVVEKD